ncbi:hypothetical protein BH23ACT11_BH23ACT11_22050 [soil metagenome]
MASETIPLTTHSSPGNPREHYHGTVNAKGQLAGVNNV